MCVTQNNKLRKLSILNLCTGYLMVFLFILLVMLNRGTEVEVEHKLIASGNDKEVAEGDLFNGIHEKGGIIYVNQHPTNLVKDYSVGPDRLRGVILDDSPDVIVVDSHRDFGSVAVIDNPNHVIIDKVDRVVIDDDLNYEISRGNEFNRDAIVSRTAHGGVSRHGRGSHVGDQIHLRDNVDGVDIGYLDRRLAEHDINHDSIGIVDKAGLERAIREDDDSKFTGLTLSKDGADLGDIDLSTLTDEEKKDYGAGKGGQLYAYNFPSQGVGAGIGSSAVGAGVGAAGLGAGIGEAILDGKVVPTLGGVGTGPSPFGGSPGSGGVGGLVGGAGAGGAAGLTQGYVTEKLGLGIEKGKGAGYGGNGGGGGYSYDHLPKDGALHIMIHVDGSGSILNTRKQLDIMKDTLLKDALLPYYNNDESL